MKQIIVALMVGLFTVTGAFANGQAEATPADKPATTQVVAGDLDKYLVKGYGGVTFPIEQVDVDIVTGIPSVTVVGYDVKDLKLNGFTQDLSPDKTALVIGQMPEKDSESWKQLFESDSAKNKTKVLLRIGYGDEAGTMEWISKETISKVQLKKVGDVNGLDLLGLPSTTKKIVVFVQVYGSMPLILQHEDIKTLIPGIAKKPDQKPADAAAKPEQKPATTQAKPDPKSAAATPKKDDGALFVF